MASYALGIKASARKELDAIDDSVFDRIAKKVAELAEDPRPVGCKKLKGYSDLWRIRIADYRVIYPVNDTRRSVEITRVAHRREVYDL